MKIYQKYYVAVQHGSELAYVLPLSGSEANITKQKDKGNSWAKKYDREKGEYVSGLSFEIDNTPTSGYEVIGFSTRYSTSNKHIYLKHPKGFHFEMTIETFIEMLKEVTVEFGIIKEDLIIYTYKGKNALCVYGGDLYNTLEEDGVKFLKVKDIREGDVISLKGKSNLQNTITYIGKRKVSGDFTISYNESEIKESMVNSYYWSSKKEHDVFSKFTTPTKEIHLFVEEVKGVKSVFSILDEKKKIKIVSVLSSTNNISNSIVVELIKSRGWWYSHMTGDNTMYEERSKLLAHFGEYSYKGNNLVNINLDSVTVENI